MKTKQQNLYTIKEVADEFGIHYLRVYRAIIAGITEPLQSKRSRLLTEDNIQELREHFDEKGENARS